MTIVPQCHAANGPDPKDNKSCLAGQEHEMLEVLREWAKLMGQFKDTKLNIK